MELVVSENPYGGWLLALLHKRSLWYSRPIRRKSMCSRRTVPNKEVKETR